MIKSVAAQFMSLPDKFPEIFRREDFPGGCGFTHEAKRGVIGARKTKFTKDGPPLIEGRTGKIVEGERNHRGSALNPPWPPAQPTRGAALPPRRQFFPKGIHHRCSLAETERLAV